MQGSSTIFALHATLKLLESHLVQHTSCQRVEKKRSQLGLEINEENIKWILLSRRPPADSFDDKVKLTFVTLERVDKFKCLGLAETSSSSKLTNRQTYRMENETTSANLHTDISSNHSRRMTTEWTVQYMNG